MAYTQQIRILEAKLIQLKKQLSKIGDSQIPIWSIEAEIRKLQRLEYEEKYERINMEEER